MPRYLAINGQNEVGASALLKQGFVARTEEFRGNCRCRWRDS